MKKEIQHKLRTLMLSAIAAVFHSNAQAEVSELSIVSSTDDKDFISSAKSGWNRIFKNVAKIDKHGDVKYIASHRSHMSHRSGGGGGGYGHRSHYSHYSSYGGGSSHYSSSSSSSSSSSYSKPKAKTAGDYSLGDRTLRLGIHGSDVTSLTGYLATNYYLKRTQIKEKEGYSLYDATVVAAVKHFQKDANLPQTGIVDTQTINKLESWDSSNTTVDLGMRTLQNSVKGTDVTELVNLLTKAGFAPDPTKIVMSNGKTLFTRDIEIAVKLFQAYNGLNVTGTTDEETIKTLRKNSNE